MKNKLRLLPILSGLLAGLGLVLLLLVVLFDGQGQTVLGNMEYALLDQRLRERSETLTPSGDIILVAFDKATEIYGSHYPELGIERSLPRDLLARVVGYLDEGGAEAIILDLELKASTDGDGRLAEVFDRAGNVYLGAYVDLSFDEFRTRVSEKNPEASGSQFLDACLNDVYDKQYVNNSEYLALLEKQALPLEAGEGSETYSYCTISPIITGLLASAEGMGLTSIQYDADAFTRRMPIFYRGYRGNLYTLLSVLPAWRRLGRPELALEGGALRVGERRIPLSGGNSVLVNWRHPRLLVEKMYADAGVPISDEELEHVKPGKPNDQLAFGRLYRHISVADILKVLEDPEIIQNNPAEVPSLFRIPGKPETGLLDLNGKLVIYGDTVKDIHRTPVGNVTYGPEMMATMLDMFLHDHRFVHPSPPWWDAAIAGILSLCIVSGVIAMPRLYFGLLAGLLLITGYWLFNFRIFISEALWFPLVWPTLLFALVLTGAVIYRYYVQDREKRRLTGVFSRYVSPQVMDEIVTNPELAMENLKGRKKELTVLFTDLHNFTSQFENAEPEEVVLQLNEYLNDMTRIVLENGGTYDKYMGDALMAFFGAPVDMPDHAAKACRAALRMRDALEALNRSWAERGMKVLRHGIGVSTGMMFVGNFGSDEIKNFTVMGSAVNLGARLEAHTRQVDADIIISGETRNRIGEEMAVRDLGEIEVKGFSKPVRVYALDKNYPAG